MAFAGIDVDQLINGVRKAQEDLLTNPTTSNPAYQYAVTRYLLNNKKDYHVEMFAAYDPDLSYTNE
jgi:glucose-6-phosphate isomerase